MADLGKNGFEYTGYSEPFIVPPTITVTAGLLSGKDLGITGIVGSVDIDYTQWRNSGLFVTSNETDTGVTSFISKDLNIDTRMVGGGWTTVGKWIITDDDGVSYVTIDDISPVDPTIMDLPENEKGQYIVTVSGVIDVVQGKTFRVVARLLDVGDAVASRTYTEGERIVEPIVVSEIPV